jgi:hypothetical protein
MVEQYFKMAKDHVQKVISLDQDWGARLPIFLLAYRASTYDIMGLTPGNLVFKRELLSAL